MSQKELWALIKRLPDWAKEDFRKLEKVERALLGPYMLELAMHDVAVREIWEMLKRERAVFTKRGPLHFLLELLRRADHTLRSPLLKKRTDAAKIGMVDDAVKLISRLNKVLTKLREPAFGDLLPGTIEHDVSEAVAKKIRPVLRDVMLGAEFSESVDGRWSDGEGRLAHPMTEPEDETAKETVELLEWEISMALSDPSLALNGLASGLSKWKAEEQTKQTDVVVFIAGEFSSWLNRDVFRVVSVLMTVIGRNVSEDAVRKAVRRWEKKWGNPTGSNARTTRRKKSSGVSMPKVA